MAKSIEVTLKLNDRDFIRGINRANNRLKTLNKTAGTGTRAFTQFGATATASLAPIAATVGVGTLALKKFGTNINQSGAQILQVGKNTGDTNKVFNKFFTEIDNSRPVVGDLGHTMGNLGKSVGRGIASIGKFAGRLVFMVAQAALAVGVLGSLVAIFAQMRSALGVAAQFEDIQITLQNLTGSAEAGAFALEMITKEAEKLPFAFEELAGATPILATISKDLGELRENINLAADISANFGIPFDQAASSLQRAFSAGAGAADVFREKGVLAAAGFEAGVSVSVDETIRKIKEFGGTIQGAAQTLNTTFSGATSQAGDALTLFNREVGNTISPFFKAFLLEIVELFRDNRDRVDEFAQQLGTNLVSSFQSVAIGGAFVLDLLESLKNAFLTIITIGGRFDTIGAIGDVLESIGLGITKGLEFAGVDFDKVEAVREFFADVGQGAQEIKAAGDSVKEGAKNIDESFKIIIGNSEETSDAIETVKTAIQQFREDLDLSKGTIEEYNAFVERLNELFKTGQIGIEEFRDLLATLDEQFAQNEGLNSFLDTLGSAQKTLSEDLVQAFREGESASGSFKKFFKTVIDQIIADVFRLAVIQPILSTILGPFGFGFGTGGNIIRLPGKASGGPVMGQRPYVVGERGPELFVPAGAGTIMPNGGFGGGQNVTYNIQAVDAPSFQQLVARDPEFIFNVSRAGARRTPAG